jgi:superfamily II DNA or RNA helicase
VPYRPVLNAAAPAETRGLALHGAWLTTGGGQLAIWAEAEVKPVKRRAMQTDAAEPASGYRSHPFCARREELNDALERLWRTARPGVAPRTSAPVERVELWLPRIGVRPMPSSTYVARGWAPEPEGTDSAAMSVWRVNAILLHAESACTLLAGLPIEPGAQAAPAMLLPHHFARQRLLDSRPMPLGDDLRFWAVAARFIMRLMLRQRYVPAASAPHVDEFGYPNSMLFGEWRLAPLDEGDQLRYDALLAAMPDAARAAAEHPRVSHQTWRSHREYEEAQRIAASFQPPARPAEAFDAFASASLNSLIPAWARASQTYLSMRGGTHVRPDAYYYYGNPYAGATMTSRWLDALNTRSQPIYLKSMDTRTLAEGVERWLGRLDQTQAPPFRLCLRLSTADERESDAWDGADRREDMREDMPEDAEVAAGDASAAPAEPPPLRPLPAEDGALDDGPDGGETPAAGAPVIGVAGAAWRLDYLLQARDDPSLLLPLGEAWDERGEVARFLDRRFERPWEHALAWLGQAAQVFPPIAASLADARPVGCDLTGADAYAFLARAIPALEELGIAVLAPAWWKRAPVKPTLRLEVRAPRHESSGLLGLDAVVSFDWKVALGGAELTAEELEQLAALKEPLVRVRGQWVELRGEDVAAALRAVAARKARQMSLGEAVRLAMTGQTEDGALDIEQVRADEWIGDLLGRMRSGETVTEVTLPAGLRAQLRPYQKRGLDWLAFLARYGLGACLADDMGLGKTIQFLALMAHLKESGAISGPALLICPTSVVGNWLHETSRFTPELRALIHHGAERVGRSNEAGFIAEAAANDLVITTYSLLPRDLKALGAVNWSVIALDEAQYIKNAETKQSHAARALSAPVRVALTGTPVENRLAELWSIMQFLNPGYLGSQKRFHERFATPIEQRRDPRATAQLNALTRPFILRRLKTDPKVISDLPEKIEMREYCTLTREQATLYEAVVRDGLRQMEQSAEPMGRRGVILAMLTRLKQVCNHPAHFLNDGSALVGRSGKLARLDDLVAELLDDGDRALIFTQFTVMGERLTAYLTERFGRETLYLHGGVARKQRERMVERFQSGDGPPLFVLSLKAGGTGLNLTNANHVIHFDRWWNPAVETQATDRAFRIGQTRNVQVRKFVCSGTLEERIDEMIERKRALAENVFGGGEGWLTELSTEELRDIFRLRAGAVAE